MPTLRALGLWLSTNKIQDDGVIAFCQTLGAATHVSSVFLDVSHNRVGQMGMAWMQEFNRIRTGGAIHFVPQQFEAVPPGFGQYNASQCWDINTIAGENQRTGWIVHGM